MKPTAVQFGAGNIGRGFIAQLFHESGYEVVFVDVVPEIVAALNESRQYRLRIVGRGAQDIQITDVRAVHGQQREQVAREVAACEIACTAVGVGALRFVAPNLAAGLQLRHAQGGGALNVLVCENLHDASGLLKSLVAEHLPEAEREAILAKVGFVQAVVSRMVPLQTEEDRREDPAGIRVEGYKKLPVDGQAVVGTLPSIVGVKVVADFEAEVERKLYTHNCMHAVMGYLGHLAGFTYGYEALEHPATRAMVDAVMEDTGLALVRKHGFDPQEHAAITLDILERSRCRELGDTCFRLARDPIRKLAPDDRLTGAARLCEAQSVPTDRLAFVIACALRFESPEDPSSLEMQQRIRSEGVERVLQSLCAVAPEEPLGRAILTEYARLARASEPFETILSRAVRHER
jgi:mannitol-1-phosphate 5-dehydrogenase